MTQTDQASGSLRSGMIQILRFGGVGVANTAIDFAITNLLVALMHPQGAPLLMAISLVACGAATLNSYLLNRRWTFRSDGAAGGGAGARFFAFAALSMIVNTSVFLFVMKYLPERYPVGDLVAVNVAKLAGVGAAFAVSFLGYRFGVFQTDTLRHFRATFVFGRADEASFALEAVVLVATGAAVRGVYLFLTTAVYGDAVSYAWVADALARGDFAAADAFWSSLFCYWEALLRIAGFGLLPGAIAASFIPGILIAVPAAWMARSLYGSTTGWIAGALCVAHPRLIEYSCNGYPEMFYILAFTAATALLTAALQRRSILAAVGWGIAFAAYTAVRNEALVAFAASLVIPLAAAWLSRRSGNDPKLTWSRAAALVIAAAMSFALTLAAYASLSRTTLGTPGLFQKTSNLGKRYSEQLDIRQAAKETYGRKTAESVAAPSAEEKARVLLRRFPRNLRYGLERLPGVLLSPVVLFALLLPFFVAHRGRTGGDELPLLLMLAFPVLFYPLIQLEPRLFFPILVPVHVFGAAGIVAFGAFAIAPERRARRLDVLLTVAIVVATTGLAAWRGVDVERSYRIHRTVAGWIEANTAPRDVITGCGYGYASTTGFLAGRRTVPRIWTSSADELAQFARSKDASWIVLYERFLRSANPELLPTLNSGIPGATLAFEARDGHDRVQVYRMTPGRP